MSGHVALTDENLNQYLKGFKRRLRRICSGGLRLTIFKDDFQITELRTEELPPLEDFEEIDRIMRTRPCPREAKRVLDGGASADPR